MFAKTKEDFTLFWKTVRVDIHEHPVITNNAYCKWFKTGQASKPQLIDLFQQFAVFSQWFLLVQLMRQLNAADMEAETRARFILANELGVRTRPDGSVEDQPFRTEWAHINWLRRTARPLDLNPDNLGRWESASPSTRIFIHELEQTYGSKDGEIGRGASYAIETWAAWGIGRGVEAESSNFWKELITGIERCNARHQWDEKNAVPLDFFLFHFNSEKGHGDNVLEELQHAFFKPAFDAEKFIQAGRCALNAIHTFWLGLEKSRLEIQNRGKRPKLSLM